MNFCIYFVIDFHIKDFSQVKLLVVGDNMYVCTSMFNAMLWQDVVLFF